jgi:hypothetical protein
MQFSGRKSDDAGLDIKFWEERGLAFYREREIERGK